MTISAQYVPNTYSGDGVTNTFPVTFLFQLQTDLVVTETVIATGITTTLVLGTHYTVLPTLNSPAGTGTLTLITGALPIGTTLEIAQSVPATQLTHWVPNDPNPSTATENAVDKLTLLSQALGYNAGRSIYLGPLDVDGSGAFNARGNRISNLGLYQLGGDAVNLTGMEAYVANLIKVGVGIAPMSFTFSGDGSTVAFPLLGATSVNPASYFVTINGVSQVPSADYSINVNVVPPQIVFTTAPPTTLTVAGALYPTIIEVRVLGFAVPITGGFDASQVVSGIFAPARLGTGIANNSVFLRGDLTWSNTIVGTITATHFAGGADGSLINSGQVLPAYLASNVGAAGQYLDYTGHWSTPAGGGGGGGGGYNTTTTSTFVIAAVNSTQTVAVTSATGVAIGNYLFIADGAAHQIIGLVTGIASLNLTVKTANILAGAAGNTMGNGAAVQLSTVPGFNTINVTDNATASTPASTLSFPGAGLVSPPTPIDLFLNSTSGQTAVLYAQPNSSFQIDSISGTSSIQDKLAILAAGNTSWSMLSPGANGTALISSGGALSWGSPTIPAASILPSMLNCTNALTDTQLFGYDAASGHFKMFVAGSGTLPPGGTTATWLLGNATWSNNLIGPIQSNDTVTTTEYANFRAASSGGKQFASFQQGGTGGANHSRYYLFDGQLVAGFNATTVPASVWSLDSTYNSIHAFNYIYSGYGVATSNNLWKGSAFFTSGVTGTQFLDFNGPGYNYYTGFTGNTTFRIDDGMPVPLVNFASELVLEVLNAGANTITFTTTAATTPLTWHAGAQPIAPSAGRIIYRFLRRQGVAGIVGYAEIGTGTIVDAMIASTAAISPSKLAGYPGGASVFLNGAGGWTTPAGSGQSAIQWQNAGTNSGTAGQASTYNITVPYSGGPKNLSVAVASTTATLKSGSPYYNVKLYGAVGDGSADDTAAINAAISAASTGGGGRVYYPAGTYKITTAVTTPSQVSHIGDGAGRRDPGNTASILTPSTTIIWGGTAGGTMFSGTGDYGGFIIEGINFNGNSSAATCLYAESMAHCQVRNCSFGLATGQAIYIFPQGGQGDFTNNTFSNLYIYVGATVCGIKITANNINCNACHCVFSDLFIIAGNYCIDIGWSDNNVWTGIFCYQVAGGTSTQQVYLRSQVGTLGAGAYAYGQYFFHLEGVPKTDAGVLSNHIYAYDRGNGQAEPVLGTGSFLFWTESQYTSMGMFFGNGTATSGVEYPYATGDACLLSPSLNSGNPVKFSRINFT